MFYDMDDPKQNEEAELSKSPGQMEVISLESNPINDDKSDSSAITQYFSQSETTTEFDLICTNSKIDEKKDGEEISVCKFFADSDNVATDESVAVFDKLTQESGSKDFLPRRSLDEEDPFSASLRASDSDRRHDAWIPSEKTRKALKDAANAPAGTFFPEREQLTMLGIVLEEDLIDPVRQLMSAQIGVDASNRRVTLTSETVPQDINGLKMLLESNYYRAAINLTGRLLVLLGQGVGKAGHPTKITPQIIQIWFVRISLLIKLRQFAIAEVEAKPFGDCDKPDLYYEFYPEIYGARKGSMVPFSFRIVLAELHLHLGYFSDALDKLYEIYSTVEEILCNLHEGRSEDGSHLEMTDENRKFSLQLWEERKTKVLFSILNCLLAQKDYTSAKYQMEKLIERSEGKSSLLWSLMGRIFLQLGDVAAAKESFAQAQTFRGATTKDKINELINNGLLCIAQNEFENAYQKFKEASEMDPTNPLIINNMGVCLLYIGRLREALKILEGTIHQKPDKFLHEGILFNVCTLYELESSHSTERKQAMLNMVGAHVGDSFNVTCLKLPVPT